MENQLYSPGTSEHNSGRIYSLIPRPRGRGLGGTSQINWMIWNLPQREEINGERTPSDFADRR